MDATEIGDIITRSDGVQYMIVEDGFPMEDISSDVIQLPNSSTLANNLIGCHIGDVFNYNSQLTIKAISHTDYNKRIKKAKATIELESAFDAFNFELAEQLKNQVTDSTFNGMKQEAIELLQKNIYDDIYSGNKSQDVATATTNALNAGAISNNVVNNIVKDAKSAKERYDSQLILEQKRAEERRLQKEKSAQELREVRNRVDRLVTDFRINDSYKFLSDLNRNGRIAKSNILSILLESIDKNIQNYVENWNIQKAEKLAKVASNAIRIPYHNFFETLNSALLKHDSYIRHRQKLLGINENGLQFGVCLDLYTVSSSGYDGAYINEYSELGRCVHDIKYNKSLSDNDKLEIIASKIIPKMYEKTKNLSMWYRDIIVTPMPFTHRRTLQPVYETAKMLANKMHVRYDDTILSKHSSEEAKKLVNGFAENDFSANYSGDITSVIIIDDTYGRGNSLRACICALKKLNTIRDIYYIGIVRNRSGGLN